MPSACPLCRRGITAGTRLTPKEQHQLYCQLRLLRLLGALPPAASLEAADLSRIARALEIEGELKQAREQANNLEGWRRADAGLRQRFEECPVLEAQEGGWRWGRHCAFCRHDRCGRAVAVCCSYSGRVMVFESQACGCHSSLPTPHCTFLPGTLLHPAPASSVAAGTSIFACSSFASKAGAALWPGWSRCSCGAGCCHVRETWGSGQMW